MRCWGFASIACVIVAVANPARAQDAADVTKSAEPAESSPDQAIGYGAMPGGIHVSIADALPKGVAEVATLVGYGIRNGLVASDHTLDRALGDIAAAYSPIRALSIGLSLDGRYDHHTGGPAPSPENGYVGDPHLYVRYAKALGTVSAGAQLGLWIPGRKAPSLVGSATSLDLRALLSIKVGAGLLSLNAGYQLDNSINSADTPTISMLSVQDRTSLGVSDYDEVYGGASLVYPAATKAWVGVEGSVEAFVGTAKTHPGNDPVAAAPLTEGSVIARGTLFGGFRLTDTFAAIAFAEVAKVPGIDYTQVKGPMIPILPYEPTFTFGVGLQARFGAKHHRCPLGTQWDGASCKELVRTKPCEDQIDPKTNKNNCPRVPIMSDLAGTVLDEDGKPIVGAKVSVKLVHTDVAPVVTDDKGAWKVNVRIGDTVKHTQPKPDEDDIDESTATVTVEVDKKKPATKTVSPLKKSGNVVDPMRLETILSGQLKVTISKPGGKPLEGATVSVGDKKATTDKDGVAVIDLPPGSYKVTLKAAGFATQELDATIEPPNGLAIKQVEMHR